jgi:hypothetical protein
VYKAQAKENLTYQSQVFKETKDNESPNYRSMRQPKTERQIDSEKFIEHEVTSYNRKAPLQEQDHLSILDMMTGDRFI